MDTTITTSIKILSYNVEAQRFHRKEDVLANGMKYYEWEYRLKLILDIIKDSEADIVCIQEVEIETFESDYKSLAAHGYGMIGHDITKEKSKKSDNDKTETTPKEKRSKRNSPIGNFVLWKTSKFKLIESAHTSCANILTLENLATKSTFKLANVHLKAGISNTDSIKTRISQLQSVSEHKPDLICGDFNDNFDKNVEIIDKVKELGYTIHNRYLTCFTISRDKENHYWCFDNVMTTNGRFIVRVPKCQSISNLQLPDDSNPSDHIPLIIFAELKN